jgi:hypothetical protein
MKKAYMILAIIIALILLVIIVGVILLASKNNDWEIVYSGDMDKSGGFNIESQAGKSEMMIQARNADGTLITACVVIPLDDKGMILSTKIYSVDPNDFECVDSRTISMNKATTIIYGLSSAESVSTGTNLKMLYIYTR